MSGSAKRRRSPLSFDAVIRVLGLMLCIFKLWKDAWKKHGYDHFDLHELLKRPDLWDRMVQSLHTDLDPTIEHRMVFHVSVFDLSRVTTFAGLERILKSRSFRLHQEGDPTEEKMKDAWGVHTPQTVQFNLIYRDEEGKYWERIGNSLEHMLHLGPYEANEAIQSHINLVAVTVD